MNAILGCGNELVRRKSHPYIGKPGVGSGPARRAALADLNRGRGNRRGEAVKVTYYYELLTREKPMRSLVQTARDVLEHGTLKPWVKEGPKHSAKPSGYDDYMSWATNIQLLGYNPRQGVESGLLTVAYPLTFFDKRTDGRLPLAQMLEGIAGEAMYAFVHYQGAKIVDVALPPSLRKRCPGPRWPNQRVRQYLGLKSDEPIVGTIVKPKTGLTPELFSACVVEAAKAGARFTKADENMHLPLSEVGRYVRRVVKDLTAAGFDLTRNRRPKGTRFLFAPHVTADVDRIRDYAKAALDAGANALMFSPYYGGGFLKMAEIIEEFDVPVYAHTAGMNVYCGAAAWGIDSRVMYLLSGLLGAAFMQITAVNGYLKPDDDEKGAILRCLQENGLDGDQGMTLAIAGGLGSRNVGSNLKRLGAKGRMILAGTSVYSHPDGPGAGVKAVILAYQAYRQKRITDTPELKKYAQSRGAEGTPLLNALE